MPATCIECDQPAFARQRCRGHYNRWHYRQNPERHRQRAKDWYRSNPDKAAANRARRDAEALRRGARDYYARNPIAGRIHSAAQRARHFGVPGVLTVEAIVARIAFYGGRCWVCGDPWQQLDHVKPLSAGGPNWPSNVRPICEPCNLTKGSTWQGAAA